MPDSPPNPAAAPGSEAQAGPVQAVQAVQVRVPTILRTYTAGAKTVDGTGATLREVIDDLESRHPGLKDRLVDGGELRRFVNVYVNDEDVRFLDGLGTPVVAGDSVTVLPAVAGG